MLSVGGIELATKKVHNTRNAMREKRSSRKLNGLCTECGSTLDRQSTICVKCYRLALARKKKYNNKKVHKYVLFKETRVQHTQLAELMDKHKLSITDIARKVGVSTKSVQRWLYHGGGILSDNLDKLENLFDVHIEWKS